MKRMTKAEMLEFGRKFYGEAVKDWTDEQIITYVRHVVSMKKFVDKYIEKKVANA